MDHLNVVANLLAIIGISVAVIGAAIVFYLTEIVDELKRMNDREEKK